MYRRAFDVILISDALMFLLCGWVIFFGCCMGRWVSFAMLCFLPHLAWTDVPRLDVVLNGLRIIINHLDRHLWNNSKFRLWTNCSLRFTCNFVGYRPSGPPNGRFGRFVDVLRSGGSCL